LLYDFGLSEAKNGQKSTEVEGSEVHGVESDCIDSRDR
jgi:hypothetical protein